MGADNRSRRRGPARRILTALAGAVAAAALAIAPAAAASAHDYLIGSDPAANSTQTQPLKAVTLSFNDVVLDLSKDGASSLLQVTGPNGAGRHFETGCPSITDRQVSVPVALGKPGEYLVTWQIVSADGHTVSDSLKFDYEPPAGTKPAPGSDERPQCGRAATTATAKPASGERGTPAATRGTDAMMIVIVIAAVVVGLALAAVVVIVLSSRRQNARRQNARRHGDSGDSGGDHDDE